MSASASASVYVCLYASASASVFVCLPFPLFPLVIASTPLSHLPRSPRCFPPLPPYPPPSRRIPGTYAASCQAAPGHLCGNMLKSAVMSVRYQVKSWVCSPGGAASLNQPRSLPAPTTRSPVYLLSQLTPTRSSPLSPRSPP